MDFLTKTIYQTISRTKKSRITQNPMNNESVFGAVTTNMTGNVTLSKEICFRSHLFSLFISNNQQY